eukprot:TRINITY_DN132_c0_g1_i2.p1 TRINITY_DN132_c0_g1~~TRINITY_DN132_c0_g1_i2.p1  ORF type:complete len:181 (+),score=38.35 TRINITY_DN132_c0_g1_i2:91-633(+)
MSTDSFAMMRKHVGKEFADLAEQHYKHDLTQGDRDTLQSAAAKVGMASTIGSVLGLGVGMILAYRVRSMRTRMFQTFRAAEKPTHVQFEGGRTEAIPDVTPLLRPSLIGDVAAFSFFGLGGAFLFGELGLLGGSALAKRDLTKDAETKRRIENAFKNFRVDALRKQADMIEKGTGAELLE